MANSNGNDASRTHFIMVSRYYKGAAEEGTKINIKALIADADISYTHPSLNSDKLKNRVILSSKDKADRPVTLISQQNLTHNIKFIHKNNDFLKPRIIFVKYNVTNKIVNSNKYLFADLTNINFKKSGLKSFELLSQIMPNITMKYKKKFNLNIFL